jgi:hypothetical protein
MRHAYRCVIERRGAMEELEIYECFGVPPHAAPPPAELAAILVRSRRAARAPCVDCEFLGIEAIPSPGLA